jgi:hypothetical protein
MRSDKTNISIRKTRYLFPRVFAIVVLCCLFGTATGQVKPNAEPTDRTSSTEQKKFIHPGVLFTQTSLDRVYLAVQKKQSPEYGSFIILKGLPEANSNYQPAGPFKVIARDGEFQFTKPKMEADFNAAYLNALMWIATKDASHAQKSLEILELYADNLQEITGPNDAPLLAGLEGIKVVTAAEILRYTYQGMTQRSIEKITRMLTQVFLPVCDQFYAAKPYTNGNWGGAVTKMYIASAIFLNDHAMYDTALNFYLHAHDNGTIENYISGTTGQIQESGRDQVHTMLGIGCLAAICEIAYDQGDDLYGALDNRLMLGFEYVAKYNLGNDDVPFTTWQDITGKYCKWAKISPLKRGMMVPIFEMAYNHYVNRKGLSMPYTKQMVMKQRPEGYDGGHPSLGTLLFNDLKQTQ